jgi:putative membrane protein insertion efficiency factor
MTRTSPALPASAVPPRARPLVATLPARLVLGLIALYRAVLSPLLGPACRFEPSCSRYTTACVERFGAARGLWLGARRIARCHPWHPGGYDPPPCRTRAGRRSPGHSH